MSQNLSAEILRDTTCSHTRTFAGLRHARRAAEKAADLLRPSATAAEGDKAREAHGGGESDEGRAGERGTENDVEAQRGTNKGSELNDGAKEEGAEEGEGEEVGRYFEHNIQPPILSKYEVRALDEELRKAAEPPATCRSLDRYRVSLGNCEFVNLTRAPLAVAFAFVVGGNELSVCRVSDRTHLFRKSSRHTRHRPLTVGVPGLRFQSSKSVECPAEGAVSFSPVLSSKLSSKSRSGESLEGRSRPNEAEASTKIGDGGGEVEVEDVEERTSLLPKRIKAFVRKNSGGDEGGYEGAFAEAEWSAASLKNHLVQIYAYRSKSSSSTTDLTSASASASAMEENELVEEEGSPEVIDVAKIQLAEVATSHRDRAQLFYDRGKPFCNLFFTLSLEKIYDWRIQLTDLKVVRGDSLSTPGPSIAALGEGSQHRGQPAWTVGSLEKKDIVVRMRVEGDNKGDNKGASLPPLPETGLFIDKENALLWRGVRSTLASQSLLIDFLRLPTTQITQASQTTSSPDLMPAFSQDSVSPGRELPDQFAERLPAKGAHDGVGRGLWDALLHPFRSEPVVDTLRIPLHELCASQTNSLNLRHVTTSRQLATIESLSLSLPSAPQALQPFVPLAPRHEGMCLCFRIRSLSLPNSHGQLFVTASYERLDGTRHAFASLHLHRRSPLPIEPTHTHTRTHTPTHTPTHTAVDTSEGGRTEEEVLFVDLWAIYDSMPLTGSFYDPMEIGHFVPKKHLGFSALLLCPLLRQIRALQSRYSSKREHADPRNFSTSVAMPLFSLGSNVAKSGASICLELSCDQWIDKAALGIPMSSSSSSSDFGQSLDFLRSPRGKYEPPYFPEEVVCDQRGRPRQLAEMLRAHSSSETPSFLQDLVGVEGTQGKPATKGPRADESANSTIGKNGKTEEARKSEQEWRRSVEKIMSFVESVETSEDRSMTRKFFLTPDFLLLSQGCGSRLDLCVAEVCLLNSLGFSAMLIKFATSTAEAGYDYAVAVKNQGAAPDKDGGTGPDKDGGDRYMFHSPHERKRWKAERTLPAIVESLFFVMDAAGCWDCQGLDTTLDFVEILKKAQRQSYAKDQPVPCRWPSHVPVFTHLEYLRESELNGVLRKAGSKFSMEASLLAKAMLKECSGYESEEKVRARLAELRTQLERRLGVQSRLVLFALKSPAVDAAHCLLKALLKEFSIGRGGNPNGVAGVWCQFECKNVWGANALGLKGLVLNLSSAPAINGAKSHTT